MNRRPSPLPSLHHLDNPLFPALRPSPTAVSGASPESKILAASGWGVADFPEAATLIGSNDPFGTAGQRTFIKEIALADGEEAEFTIRTAGGTPIKATAAWTDPNGATVPNTLDPSNLNLVNNLDLRVYRLDSGGNVLFEFKPWALNPSSPFSPATRTQNDRDNVEQVLTSGAPGNQIWKVVVRQKAGTTIVGDDGVTPGTQVVSVVLSGVSNRNIPFSVTNTSFDFSGGMVTATLTWGSHAGEYFELESSTDLVNWVTASGVFNARADATTGESDPFPTTPSRFFRVRKVSPDYVAP